MGKKYDFDYIVIGSGTAGSTAALMAAGTGLSVALVEADKWGGNEINYRDLPYNAALHFSHSYAKAIWGAKFGLSSVNLRYNYPTAMNWRMGMVKKTRSENKKRFEEAGITCIKGFAHFVNTDTISVGDKQYAARKFLIATGAVLKKTEITGAEENCLVPGNALNLNRLPKVVLVVGAGATGCETAEYFAELGAKVLLLESEGRILPKEDAEVAQTLQEFFEKKLGIKVLTGAKVVAVEQADGAKKVVFMNGKQEKSVRVEVVVLATGSAPATDLGLENAKIKYNVNGIVIDKMLQTSNKNVSAAGDVIGGESSTERAAYLAAIATSNIINRNKGAAESRRYTRVVNTLPKVACVGLTETECKAQKLKYKTALVPMSQVSAAQTEDFSFGFVKMIANRDSSKILGAAVVCPEADIVAQEISLAIKAGLKPLDLASTPHVAASWNEAVRLAARQVASN